MADQLLDQVRDALEMTIDFEGQRLAEQMSTIMLAVVGAVCFIVGYLTQNIHYSLWTGLGGTALTFLAVLPPWPFFNQKPVKWLPPRNSPTGNIQIQVGGTTVQ